MLKGSNLAIIYSEIGPEYVQEGWKYIVKACGSNKHPEELDQVVLALANAFPGIGEEIMTFAQQFKQEGLLQGLQQGEQRGMEKGRLDERFAIAKNLLGMGIDLNSIKAATHLSEEEISRLRLH
jgi:hypothetical protein